MEKWCVFHAASRHISKASGLSSTVISNALRKTRTQLGPRGSLKRSARAVRVQCARSATIWASGRTRDAYFEILGAPRGIMVTPSGGYARRSTFGSRHGKA